MGFAVFSVMSGLEGSYSYLGCIFTRKAVVAFAFSSVGVSVVRHVENVSLNRDVNGERGVRAIVLCKLGHGDGRIFRGSSVAKRQYVYQTSLTWVTLPRTNLRHRSRGICKYAFSRDSPGTP